MSALETLCRNRCFSPQNANPQTLSRCAARRWARRQWLPGRSDQVSQATGDENQIATRRNFAIACYVDPGEGTRDSCCLERLAKYTWSGNSACDSSNFRTSMPPMFPVPITPVFIVLHVYVGVARPHWRDSCRISNSVQKDNVVIAAIMSISQWARITGVRCLARV